MVRRSAFTLIELIFAIVVIAISVVSLPVMTQRTDANIEAGIIQEAIFASQAVVNESMGYYWDTNTLYDSLTSDASRVIDINGISCTGAKRVGHITRKCVSDSSVGVRNNTGIIAAQAVENLVTNYNDRAILRGLSSTTAYATYKENYKAKATIKHCTDTGGCIAFGENSYDDDLKEVSFDIKKNDGEVVVRLRYYIANIGEPTIGKRTF